MSASAQNPSAANKWGDDDAGLGVLHVDMDAFFAAVEIALRPKLRGQPVVVGRRDRGVVIAANYEARAYGVRSAMPMSRALGLCPRAQVIPPTHQRYHEVSLEVMELLRAITPQVETISIDEAFLEVTGARKQWGSARQIAQYIRREVSHRHQITCSVGIATSPVVAKLASTHAKPDGMLLVSHDRTVDFLHSLPVGALPGVGPRTEAILRRWGIHKVAQLAHTDLAILMRVIGKAQAVRLHEIAWNQEKWEINPDRFEKSVGTETTLETDVSDTASLQRSLLALADRTAQRARRAQVVGRVVVIKVRTSDFKTFSRSRTLSAPIDDGPTLNRVAQELFAAHDPQRPIRLLGVRLEGLSDAETTPRQLSFDTLWQERPPHATKVTRLVDQVREKFGVEALKPGSLVEGMGRDAKEGPGELS